MEPKKNYQFYTTSREAWTAMEEAIEKATKSIYWESYIFANDEVGNKFLKLLKEKKRQGVEVKLIFDAIGSYGFSNKAVEELRREQIDINFFHGRSSYGRYPKWWQRLWERTHRKILVIDEAIGFIGGVNIDAQHADWLDLHLKIETPLVRILIREFTKNYFWSGGTDDSMKQFKHLRFRQKRGPLQFIFTYPSLTTSRSRWLMIKAIKQAQRELLIINSYFIPDLSVLYALKKAAKRGVRIKLLTPKSTDIWLQTYATQSLWEYLQNHGINIYLVNQMLHAKAIVVDNAWATVGTINLDYRSFFANHEVNLVFADPEMLSDLKCILDDWFAKATLLEAKDWTKRAHWQRIKEWVAIKFKKWL